jgi:hypothetical protein
MGFLADKDHHFTAFFLFPQRSLQRGPGAGVEDDPARLPASARGVVSEPDGKPGLVGQDRTDPDEDGIMEGAELMGLLAGGRRGDPLRMPGGGGDPAIQGHGPFGRDQRPSRPDLAKERGIGQAAVIFQDPFDDFHPFGP